MNPHATSDESDDPHDWTDTPHGRAEAAAIVLANAIAPFVMERILEIIHRAAVGALAANTLREMRSDPVFTALAPVLDPLLACAVSASEESPDMPDGTVGLDGTAVIHTMLSTIVERLGLAADHPALSIDDDDLDTSRATSFINWLTASDHEYEPPWHGPHPITDRVEQEGLRIAPGTAIDLARQAIALLRRDHP